MSKKESNSYANVSKLEEDDEEAIQDEEEINQEEIKERLKRLKDRILDPAEDDQFYNKEEDITIK